jgi:hypothetical protein
VGRTDRAFTVMANVIDQDGEEAILELYSRLFEWNLCRKSLKVT